MGDKKNVFISYSTKNEEIVEKTYDYLVSKGLSCWLAPKEIPVAGSFAEEITKALSKIDVFLLMFSKEAQESEYVNKEVEIAFYKNIPIIAFNIDGNIPSSEGNEGLFKRIKKLFSSSSNHENNMDFFLRNTQWLFAYPNPENYFDKLFNDISRILADVNRGVYRPPPPFDFEKDDEKPPQSFITRHKRLIIALVVILIVGAGFILYSGMGTNSSDDLNETAVEIDYIGVADDGVSYFVYGTVTANDTSGYVVKTDFYDESGDVIGNNTVKLDDVEGNIICQSVIENNVSKVSVKLLDSNNQEICSAESENIIK